MLGWEKLADGRPRAFHHANPKKGASSEDTSPRIVSWIPLTRNQTLQFVAVTTRGAWIGIGAMAVFWVTVRFIGPAAGWWTLADTP